MTTTAAVNFISTNGFPAPGLRATQRLITGHSEEDGKGHFLVTDRGDHHRIMGENQAVANILYSTQENPVDLNDSKDIQYARENEVRLLFFIFLLRFPTIFLSPDFLITLPTARSPHPQRHSGSDDRFRPRSRIPNAPRPVH